MTPREHFTEDVRFALDTREMAMDLRCASHKLIASAVVPAEWILTGFVVSEWLRGQREDHLRRYHPGLGPLDIRVTSRIL